MESPQKIDFFLFFPDYCPRYKFKRESNFYENSIIYKKTPIPPLFFYDLSPQFLAKRCIALLISISPHSQCFA